MMMYVSSHVGKMLQAPYDRWVMKRGPLRENAALLDSSWLFLLDMAKKNMVHATIIQQKPACDA